MLRSIAPEIWVAEHPLTLFAVRVGARMTVIRLEDGSLWLCSPIPLDDAGAAELEQLGPVRHIVAPNLFHHLYAVAAKARWPSARLYGAPGLRAKLPALGVEEELGDTAPEAWRRQIDQHVMAGMPKVNEVVFFHRNSKTLVTTDLFFNLHDLDHWWSRTFLKLNDAYGRFGMSRFFRSNITDGAAARRSADRVLSWDFERVVMAHGDIVESDARDAVASAVSELR